MNGVHDMGGMQCYGPVRPETDEPVFHADWERRALAVTLAVGALMPARREAEAEATEARGGGELPEGAHRRGVDRVQHRGGRPVISAEDVGPESEGIRVDALLRESSARIGREDAEPLLIHALGVDRILLRPHPRSLIRVSSRAPAGCEWDSAQASTSRGLGSTARRGM